MKKINYSKISIMVLIVTLSLLMAHSFLLPVKIVVNEVSSLLINGKTARKKKSVTRIGGNELNLNSITESKSNSPKVYVKLDDSIKKLKTGYPLYLRQSTYSLFDGSRWRHKEVHTLKRFVDKEEGVEDEITMVNKYPDGKVFSQFVFIVEQSSKQALSLPGAFAFRMPEVLAAEDDIYILPLKNGRAVAYEVISSYYTFSDIENKSPETISFKSEYQSLPETLLMAKIEVLARNITKDSKNTIQKIQNIKKYLNDNYSYKIKVVSKNKKNTLEEFLFENKEGHCTLFATAFTLLLRSAGIPARVGVGYCGGAYVPEHDLYCFREKDAHAWSEVYFKKYGWVVIDATPESNATQETIYSSTFTDDIDKLIILGELSKKNHNNLKNISLHAKRIERYTSWILMCLLSLLSISVIFILIKNIFFNSYNSNIIKIKKIKDIVEPGYFESLSKGFAKRGYPRKRSQTAEEYLIFLKDQELVDDELDEIIDYYYKTRYTLALKDKRKEKEFKAIIDKCFRE